MAIIINPARPSAGYMFGAGLGQTLGQGLQDIAQQKLNELNARQATSRISQSLEGLGLSPQDAQVFAQLPESQRGPAALDYLQQLAQSQPEQIMQQEPMPAMQQLQQQPVAQQASTEGVQNLKQLFEDLGRGNQLPGMRNQQQGLNAESFDSILKRLGAQQQLNQQQQAAPLAPAPGTAPQRELPKPPIQQEPQPQPKRPLSAQQFLASRPELIAQVTAPVIAAETDAQQSKREQQEERSREIKQRRINSSNKQFLDRLRSRSESARSLKSLAEEMQDLLNTGKVNSGLYGNYAPLWAQNAESQQFAAKSAELQQELASKKAGVASKARLELARQAKANLSQDPATQAALLNKVIREADEELKYDQIKDDLILANNGEQPANLETLVAQRARQEQTKEQTSKQLNTVNSLEEAKAKGAKKVRDTVTGKIITL